jgi:peptide/nickel transport system permease protein
VRRYLLRRCLQTLFILWALLTILFFLFRLMPGDPVGILVSADLTAEAKAALRAAWGLDRPLAEQYVRYVGNLLSGDFGLSFQHRLPVWQVLGEKVVNTLVLMVPATILGILLGVLGGLYFGWRRSSGLGQLGVLLPPVIRAMPVFWLGVLLLMAFSYTLRLFPNGGMRSLGSPPGGWAATFLSLDFLWHLSLPLLCTVITSIPEPMLIMRTSLLETRGEDFLELVTAKGVKESVVLRHAARNSLLPVVTWVFHMFGYAMSGTVLVEVVFAWPGLGRELVSAVNAYDYPLCQAAFFLISVIVLGLNLVNDLVYGLLDPRVTVA